MKMYIQHHESNMHYCFLRGYTSVFRLWFFSPLWTLFCFFINAKLFIYYNAKLWSDCSLIYLSIKLIQFSHKIKRELMNFNYFQIAFRVCIFLCVCLTIFWICFRYHVIRNDNDALSNDTIDGCNDTICDVVTILKFVFFFYFLKNYSNSNFQSFLHRKPKHGKD